MIIAYIRKSTEKQEFSHMEFEIQNYADSHKLKIDRWIEESISSRKPLHQRKLGKLLNELQANDVLITTELSRISRSVTEVFSILQICLNKSCQVITIKENYHLGNDLQSKVLAFAFGLSAEIERNLISQRTKRCLDRLRAEGKHIGRKKGSKNKNTKLSGKDYLIKTLLSQHVAKTQIARMLKVDYTTLYRFMKEMPA